MIVRLCLLLALATTLFGQPPHGMFPWWDMPLANDLNLTADQRDQARSIVREHRTRLIDLRAAAEKAEIELEDLYNQDSLDQRRAAEAIDRVVAARGELMRTVSQMSLKLRALLTAEQWRELQKRREEGRGRRGMRRGPMDPNAPPR